MINEQIGGNHYQNFKIQPLDLILMCDWSFCKGNIVKYVLRRKFKGGLEDLSKARHYCEIASEHDGQDSDSKTHKHIVDVFCEINDIDENIKDIINNVDNGFFKSAKVCIEQLMEDEYGEQ